MQVAEFLKQILELIKWKIIGRPTDRALIAGAADTGFKKTIFDRGFPKIDEIPFNTENYYP